MLSRFQVFDEDGKPKLDSSSSDVAQLNDLNDVALSPASSGEVLQHDGGHFVNRSLASAGIAAAGDLAGHESDTGNPHSVTAAQAGALAAANDLSDLNDAATARGNLGLGSAAQSNTGDFAAASHNHAAADINSGTLAHERGGLEADVSAFDGLVKISGGATSQAAEGTDFYAPGGTDVPVSDGGTGASDAASARNNLSAARTHVLAVDPDADYDSADGVLAGDLALNTTSGAVFICSDNSSGAAVWGQIGGNEGGGGLIDLNLPYDANVFGGGSDGDGDFVSTLSANMEYNTLRIRTTCDTQGYRILADEKVEWGPSGLLRNDGDDRTGAPGGTYCGAGQDGAVGSAADHLGVYADAMGGAGGWNNGPISSNKAGGYPGGVSLADLTALQQLVDGKFGTTLLKGGCGGGNTSGNYGGGGGGVIIVAAPHISLHAQQCQPNNSAPESQTVFPAVDVRGAEPVGGTGGSGVVILVAEYISGHQLVVREHDFDYLGGPTTLIVAAKNAKQFAENHRSWMMAGNYAYNFQYGSQMRTKLPNYIIIQLT